MTLKPTPITAIAEQPMSLNCTSSLSNPSANIVWFMSSRDITSQSTFTTMQEGHLFKTVSSLNYTFAKHDNKKQMFCTASNLPGNIITSGRETLNVLCKFID